MKANQVVFYRICLFGMLFVILNNVYVTYSLSLNNPLLVYISPWDIAVKAVLFVIVFVLILTHKKMAVTVNGLPIVPQLAMLAALFMYFIFISKGSNVPEIRFLCFVLFIACAAGGMAGFKQGAVVQYLMGMDLKSPTHYSITNKQLVVIGTVAVMVVSITNHMIDMVVRFTVYAPFNVVYKFDMAMVLTWILAACATLLLYKQKQEQQAVKEHWVKLLIWFCCFYTFLVDFHMIGYRLIYDGYYTGLVYLLFLILPLVIFKIPLRFKNNAVSGQEIIRLALLVFPAGYIVGTLTYQYLQYGVMCQKLYLYVIVGAVPMLFSKQIAQRISGGQ